MNTLYRAACFVFLFVLIPSGLYLLLVWIGGPYRVSALPLAACVALLAWLEQYRQ